MDGYDCTDWKVVMMMMMMTGSIIRSGGEFGVEWREFIGSLSLF